MLSSSDVLSVVQDTPSCKTLLTRWVNKIGDLARSENIALCGIGVRLIRVTLSHATHDTLLSNQTSWVKCLIKLFQRERSQEQTRALDEALKVK